MVTFRQTSISKNSYLLTVSNHPSHCCNNIPYSLAFKILRNCIDPEQQRGQVQGAEGEDISRGYRERIVDNAVENVKLGDGYFQV